MMGKYRELVVWKKAVELSVLLYEVTEKFPIEERYGLTSQMRRACISIPSNIAEGKMRGYDGEFKKFLLIAYSSGAELETQITIAKRLHLTSHIDFASVEHLLDEVMRMLNTLIMSIRPKANG